MIIFAKRCTKHKTILVGENKEKGEDVRREEDDEKEEGEDDEEERKWCK